MEISRGTGALHRLLTERTFDLRALDVAGFRAWLDRHLARWARDPVFVQRSRIRDLRRTEPRIRALEAEERRAEAVDRASPTYERLHQTEHELSGAEKAISGLGEALGEAAPEKRAAMERKLEAFRKRQRDLRVQLTEVVASSPERQALLAIRAERQRLRAELGLDREEARLRALLRARGRSSGRRGADFEAAALAATERCILPDLLGDAPVRFPAERGVRGCTPPPPAPPPILGEGSTTSFFLAPRIGGSRGQCVASLSEPERGRATVPLHSPAGIAPDPAERQRVRVLQGVTLGAARMEIDQLLVRCSGDADEPVEVLALVEVKRNVNDLAHGFGLRQENLAWLTGDEARYDPEAYRTSSFPEGRFDRAIHESGGERYVFDAGSFRRFRPDPATGLLLDGLYLVTRPGAIWGVASAALARIAYRVSTDERWAPENEAYLRKLLEWCRSLAHGVETPDVLRTYAAAQDRAQQLLLLES